VTRRLTVFGILVALAIAGAACTAINAFRKGETAIKAGDLDQAVAYYRAAVQAAPDNANYRIALERAMQAASRMHIERAKDFEQKDQLDAALGEYKLATEYEPSNRLAVAKVAALERTIRDRIEASRPKPPIQEMRERVRAASEPILNPASRQPLNFNFNNTSIKAILDVIANATGINITYDREVVDRGGISLQLNGVTLEQALNQIMASNGLSYKIVNERSILVFPDTSPKHLQYDDQVIKTIYLSNADPQEIVQILSAVARVQGLAIQPVIYPNKTSNSVTIRGTTQMVQILEKMVEQNDKPRAEIVVDVEILEVNRQRTKQYGLNLTDYSIGAIFSPEVNPAGGGTTTPTTPTTPSVPGSVTPPTSTAGSSSSRAPSSVTSGPLFNLNTVSHGISTADFYLAVPAAIVRFLETDNRTKIIAKPQLRGAEGQKLTLALGQSIPVIQTAYTPLATGGAGVNPLSSYNYKDVGVNIEMSPRVTLEGDIILDLTLDDSAVGGDRSVAGVTVPFFVQRKVTTRLRLRDGESNLLAGLLQEQESNQIQGFPGAIHVPVLSQLFSGNTRSSDQTDIVMLLTPHIVRTQEITEENLKPIYIGSQGAAGAGLSVGGPPPLIAPPPEPQPQAGSPMGTVTAPTPSTAIVTIPPGSTPIPGTVVAPAAATPPPATTPTTPPGTAPQPTPPPVAETTPPAVQPPQPQVPPTPAQPAGAEAPTTSPGIGSAQVLLNPSGTTFRVGGGPYTVPISINNATRITMITLTLTFDPAVLRVRSVQEGSFMKTGGANATFTQQAGNGRVDITLSRGADAIGASGTGLLAVVLFDAIAPGAATLSLSGAATGPGGTAMGLQFRPVTITVQQ
jgi:general secretion pathway protein D